LTVVALLFALAKPQSFGEARAQGEGIAIQMVLDVSGSMAEEDFVLDGRPARRLDAVKRVFRDFVLGRGPLRGREGDLIGMTTFAMYADSPCPLTPDVAGVVELLDQTEIPGWAAGRKVRDTEEAGYTALGDGIVLATDDLRRAGEQAVAGVPGAEAAKSKVMVLLTDGANNPAPFPGRESPKPLEAAKIAAALGIRIYTIGAAGSPGRAAGFGAFLRPTAQVDEPTLMEIAQLTGGKYFRATDVDSLQTIYEEIDRLERRRTGERSLRDNLHAANVAILAAIGLLALELCLANTRYRIAP
jgi:Ca-activated chloride channel family protein